jgi:hypothetical protein
MSEPGPFFNPFCRPLNLPLMNGLYSTHGEVVCVELPSEKDTRLGVKLRCFGTDGPKKELNEVH